MNRDKAYYREKSLRAQKKNIQLIKNIYTDADKEDLKDINTVNDK